MKPYLGLSAPAASLYDFWPKIWDLSVTGRFPLQDEREERSADRAPELSFEIPQAELKMIAKRRYWAFKRAIDCLGALILLVICSPLWYWRPCL